MDIRTPRRPGQDLRDYPIYTVTKAARYLGMPQRTLYHWLSDHPLWSAAGVNLPVQLLSFKDLAQSHFIEFVRRHAKISTHKAREILKNAQLDYDRWCAVCARVTKHQNANGEDRCENCAKKDKVIEFPKR